MEHVIRVLTILAVAYFLITIIVMCLGKKQRQKTKNLSDTYIAGCGHTFSKTSLMVVNYRLIRFTLPKNGPPPPYCPTCFRESIIQCAGCKKLISPGDKVCLYGGFTPEQVPKHAYLFTNDPIQLVYCTHCAKKEEDIVGTWEPTKRIKYFEQQTYYNIN